MNVEESLKYPNKIIKLQINFYYNYSSNSILMIFFLETILLEKTPAFAIDYLFTLMSNSYQNNCDNENESYSIE